MCLSRFFLVLSVGVFIFSPFAVKSAPTRPTSSPTKRPTSRPINSPTRRPTPRPTNQPTNNPTLAPTNRPTNKPTLRPTNQPTNNPTLAPTNRPTNNPTLRPTSQPTNNPTRAPTNRPTNNPTFAPTIQPTNRPSNTPSRHPTNIPTRAPTNQPTNRPTNAPTSQPTNTPTRVPTNQPTLNPTRAPTKRPTNAPTRQPTNQPTTIPVYECPLLGSEPLSIDTPNGPVQVVLKNSSPDVLCILLAVSSQSTSNNIELIPVGRSYGGHSWEPYHGPFSDGVSLGCSRDHSVQCLVDLPFLPPGRSYILKSFWHSLEDHEAAARFLEKTTFGPTLAEISSFRTPQEWFADQLAIPVTSHRQFFRDRLTNYHGESTYYAGLFTGSCKNGARYRKFVFMAKDVNRFLEISRSPLDAAKRILAVDGHVRSIVTGNVRRGTPVIATADLPDGR
jgi:hypothetical protein